MIGKVTDCIIMVEPRHCKVYKKFGFMEFSDIKLDVDANNAESKLMRLKLRENGAIVHYPCFDNVFNELKGFLSVLNDSLAKHQEISLMHDKFLSNNYLSEQEYKLFNFRGFLINSYFHNSKLNLQQQKINNNWDNNYFMQAKAQLVQLIKCCYRMPNELKLSQVS
jgi:hypothetical protein